MFSCGENNDEKVQKEEIENDLTRANIKGKVKEIIETTFSAKESFGEPQKGDLRTKDISKYNEDGNRTEETSYNADGELARKYKDQYDEDGNRTEVTFYNADGELGGKHKYQYDEDGNITESTSYNADGEIDWKYKYQYDEFDNLKNWIVRTLYGDDILESIIEREIEYYE
jgi:YD repeat-containing protein